MFSWGIQSLTFSGGEEIPLINGSTLIILGPNGAGKSTSLADIAGLIGSPDSRGTVVRSINTFCTGSEQGFLSWLKEHFGLLERDRLYFNAIGTLLKQEEVSELWDLVAKGRHLNQNKIFGAPFFYHRLNAESRLQIGNTQKSIDFAKGFPNTYLHIFQADENLLSVVSSELSIAFDVELIINWGRGSSVGFHVGKEPVRSENRDRTSRMYLNELNRMPRLEEAGDGIRSFVGVLLASLCGNKPVLLIDEPEAFLHPPQIKRLDALLSKNAERRNRQVIIATHSSEVIKGALSESKRVSICRLTRHERSNHAVLLSSDEIEQLWSKPLLKSSAAIDGLFHHGVVVCEGDSDSRFYEAVVQRLQSKQVLKPFWDFFFIHGGGKGELFSLASSYFRLKVPVAVIADIDLLKSRQEFQRLFSLLGGDFNRLESIYNQTISGLNNLPPTIPTNDFVKRARVILNRVNKRGLFSSSHRESLMQLIDYSGDWSEAKRYGIRKLRGGHYEAARRLLKACQEVGLFIVPYGELESWWEGGPAKKNEWFSRAMEQIALDPDSLKGVFKFMTKVCNYLVGGVRQLHSF